MQNIQLNEMDRGSLSVLHIWHAQRTHLAARIQRIRRLKTNFAEENFFELCWGLFIDSFDTDSDNHFGRSRYVVPILDTFTFFSEYYSYFIMLSV